MCWGLNKQGVPIQKGNFKGRFSEAWGTLGNIEIVLWCNCLLVRFGKGICALDNNRMSGRSLFYSEQIVRCTKWGSERLERRSKDASES